MTRQRAQRPGHPVRRALWHALAWLIRLAVITSAAVAVAPVTVVAAVAAGYAWWRGWPPQRLQAAALRALPMTVAWLIAVAAWPPRGPVGAAPGASATSTGSPPGAGPGSAWFRVVAAPYRAWSGMWQLAAHGHLAAAVVAIIPLALPLGIAAGGLAWTYRNFRMRTGAGGLTPAAPAAFDQRQWRHQARTARALIAAPDALPLLSRGGQVLVGATIRAVRHRPGRSAAIPYERLRAHQVVIGSTGTGKTTLLLRLWAGFMAAGLRGYAAGSGRRPLLVILDCKGGASSRKVADRVRRVLRDAGARSTAIWPDEAALSLWTLPPDRLITTLLDLIEHGTGGAAYYADVMEALVTLAVDAPCGPPANAADFLARLDADWVSTAYGASADASAVATARSAKGDFASVRLRFAALWRRLGTGLDGGPGYGGATGRGGGVGSPGGATFADADAWYCVLEGTAEPSVAQAQARALTDLLAFYALGGQREILLAVDEFSAVSRRLPIWQLYERARSLGLAVQVSAQSWEGLADSQDERHRVASTAEGGIWLLRTPRPEPVAELAGTLPAVETTRRFSGAGAWAGDGLSRSRPAPVLDGNLVRRLDVGQVAYVYRGGVTYVQVKRLTGRQAAIGTGARAATLGARPTGLTGTGSAPGDAIPDTRSSDAAGTAGFTEAVGAGAVSTAGAVVPGMTAPGMTLPDASEVLDEAFGKRRA